MNNHSNKSTKSIALQVLIFFGLISLFGDIIYEGARSVNGPFLNILGASAGVVGLIGGLGEFLGYAIRLISGYLSDKLRSRWLFVIIGYAMLISVPLLSLAGHWELAVLFILMERVGKALRGPARDTIISEVSKGVGTGWAFGFTEALDQIGALIGPLIFTGLFLFLGKSSKNVSDYHGGYSLLWIPFILLMICIFAAFRRFPNPERGQVDSLANNTPEKFSRSFWLYIAFTFVATMGFVNFLLLGYHYKLNNAFSDATIPLLYAIAMIVDGVAALAIGKTYDVLKNKNSNQAAGLLTLIIIPVLSLILIFFVFSSNFIMVLFSMVLWGIVMGAHETIMRSAIADITHIKRRGTGYGIFNTAYGLAMLLGSSLMGLLYGYSHVLVIVVVVIIEIFALFLFFVLCKEVLKYPKLPPA